MGISLRDDSRGQGLVEYLLVLVVAVTIILGGIYQLNSAFRVWAENYFGNYLACLLETGELPSLGGTPGDSGVCNTLFKPYSLAEGRQLGTKFTANGGSSNAGNGNGATEETRGSPVGGGSSFSGGRFGASSGAYGGGKGSTNRMKGKSDSQYTGSTGAADYGGGYSATNRRISTDTKKRLDTSFAFDASRERQSRRTVASTPISKAASEAAKKNKVVLNNKGLKKDDSEAPDSGFTLANFLWWIIVIGIILSLVIFLGGQMLQVGKSME